MKIGPWRADQFFPGGLIADDGTEHELRALARCGDQHVDPVVHAIEAILSAGRGMNAARRTEQQRMKAYIITIAPRTIFHGNLRFVLGQQPTQCR